MPKTWSEAERHICFTDALIEHIDKLKLEQIEITVRLNNKLPLAKELAARWPYDKSAAAFEALVKDLGLPWEHYRHYLHNLKQRYRLGTTN